MSKLGRQLETTLTVLRRPHVTERSSMLSFNAEQPVYTFKVAGGANKSQIRQVIEKLYQVKPVRINVVNLPAKRVIIRGKRGTKPGFKKALVFLKKGDKIDFV